MRLWDNLLGRFTKAKPEPETKPSPKAKPGGKRMRIPGAKWWYVKRAAWLAVRRNYPTYTSAGQTYRHKGDGSEVVIGRVIYLDDPRGFRKVGVSDG